MKAFARELIWFFIALTFAIPIGYLFSYVIGLQPEGPKLVMTEEVFQMEMFIIGAILGFICTYIMRVIIWATAKFLVKENT